MHTATPTTNQQTTHEHPFHDHQPALAGASSSLLPDPHALADGNQRIRIRQKTLEFSSTLLSALSPYLKTLPVTTTNARV